MILKHHRTTLEEDSAIAESVWQTRGYVSVEKAVELKKLGFSPSQSLVPSLVIPVFNVWGELALYHHRPDNPRVNGKTGRINKYEFPYNSTMCLDVHPLMKEKVRDPNTPLCITEGAKKNDSIISHGGCAISVIGVWNWRGKTTSFFPTTPYPEVAADSRCIQPNVNRVGHALPYRQLGTGDAP